MSQFTDFNSKSLKTATEVMGQTFTSGGQEFSGVMTELVVDPDLSVGGYQIKQAFSILIPLPQLPSKDFFTTASKIVAKSGRAFKVIKVDSDEIAMTLHVTDVNR